jgi:hypothetical protein
VRRRNRALQICTNDRRLRGRPDGLLGVSASVMPQSTSL